MFVLRDDGPPTYFYTVDIREPHQIGRREIDCNSIFNKVRYIGSAHATTNTILVVVLFI